MTLLDLIEKLPMSDQLKYFNKMSLDQKRNFAKKAMDQTECHFSDELKLNLLKETGLDKEYISLVSEVIAKNVPALGCGESSPEEFEKLIADLDPDKKILNTNLDSINLQIRQNVHFNDESFRDYYFARINLERAFLDKFVGKSESAEEIVSSLPIRVFKSIFSSFPLSYYLPQNKIDDVFGDKLLEEVKGKLGDFRYFASEGLYFYSGMNYHKFASKYGPDMGFDLMVNNTSISEKKLDEIIDKFVDEFPNSVHRLKDASCNMDMSSLFTTEYILDELMKGRDVKENIELKLKDKYSEIILNSGFLGMKPLGIKDLNAFYKEMFKKVIEKDAMFQYSSLCENDYLIFRDSYNTLRTIDRDVIYENFVKNHSSKISNLVIEMRRRENISAPTAYPTPKGMERHGGMVILDELDSIAYMQNKLLEAVGANEAIELIAKQIDKNILTGRTSEAYQLIMVANSLEITNPETVSIFESSVEKTYNALTKSESYLEALSLARKRLQTKLGESALLVSKTISNYAASDVKVIVNEIDNLKFDESVDEVNKELTYALLNINEPKFAYERLQNLSLGPEDFDQNKIKTLLEIGENNLSKLEIAKGICTDRNYLSLIASEAIEKELAVEGTRNTKDFRFYEAAKEFGLEDHLTLLEEFGYVSKKVFDKQEQDKTIQSFESQLMKQNYSQAKQIYESNSELSEDFNGLVNKLRTNIFTSASPQKLLKDKQFIDTFGGEVPNFINEIVNYSETSDFDTVNKDNLVVEIEGMNKDDLNSQKYLVLEYIENEQQKLAFVSYDKNNFFFHSNMKVEFDKRHSCDSDVLGGGFLDKLDNKIYLHGTSQSYGSENRDLSKRILDLSGIESLF